MEATGSRREETVPGGSGLPVQTLRAGSGAGRERSPVDRLLLGILTIAGTIAVLASIAEAFRNAIQNSMDFQWSGAHLLLLHRDPWAIYLSGDPYHQILLVQIPNYLHELYVFLLPLAAFRFPTASILWAVCNLFFVLVLSWYVSRLCELTNRRTLILFFLVLTSTPFRVTVGNGQNGALALAALALWAIVRSDRRRGLLLGVAYEKYSLFPVLVLFLLMRRRWKLFTFSLIPPVLGFLFVKVWLGTAWVTLAIEPFLTAMHKGSVSPGWANIVAMMQNVLHLPPYTSVLHLSPAFHGSLWVGWLPYALALLLACALAVYFSRYCAGADGRILLACLMASSLACFPHQIYDFLALAFPLAIALKSRPSGWRTAVLGIIGYFWYLERLFELHRWKWHLFVIVPSFLLLLGLIAATYQLRKTAEWSEQWEI